MAERRQGSDDALPGLGQGVPDAIPERRRPLASRMRPRNLTEVVGHAALLGPEALLPRLIKADTFGSLLFYGPPGCGKTTLAEVIAAETQSFVVRVNAVLSGTPELREILADARRQPSRKTVLVVDEIHRFNKSQQDAFLPHIEDGTVFFVGATTENPSFEVIAALLSRCQVYILNSFSKDDLEALLKRAMTEDELLSKKKIRLKETEALLRLSGGDARKLLNIFELIINSESEDSITVTNDLVLRKIQNSTVLYDKTGDQHYDIISAFIKSIRGSDPNGAVYWLARMLEGGEDAKFIARRLLILASEDIGNANPTALVLANSTFQSVAAIGMPESRIILSQCTTYLACSPKSNAAYAAINQAIDVVKNTGNLAVPLDIRNAPTKLMKDLGYGESYKYAHNYDLNFVTQEFLPEDIENTQFYKPGNNTRENAQQEFLKQRWKDKYKS